MEILGGVHFFCRSILPAEDSRRPHSSGYGFLSCTRAREGQFICLRRQSRHFSCHSVLSCTDPLWSFGNGREGRQWNAAGCKPSGSDGNSILASRENNGLAREKEEDDCEEEEGMTEINRKVQNYGDSAELPTEIDRNDSVESLNDLLQQAKEDLDTARMNSARLEEIAREVAEKAIALREKASIAEKEANMATELVRAISEEESEAEEALQKAESTLLLNQNDTYLCGLQPNPLEEKEKEKEKEKEGEEETRISESESRQSVVENKAQPTIPSTNTSAKTLEEERVDFNHEKDSNVAHLTLSRCQEELQRIRDRKPELEAEALQAKEASEKAKLMAVLANEDAANAMLLAEQAVAMEMEAVQRLSDTEIALQKAINTPPPIATNANEMKVSVEIDKPQEKFEGEDNHIKQGEIINSDNTISSLSIPSKETEEIGEDLEKLSKTLLVERSTWVEEEEGEKSKVMVANSSKKADVVMESPPPPPPILPPGHPKSMTKKSSRFFSASYFFFEDDGAEFTPGTAFQGFVLAVKKQFPKVVLGLLVLTAGGIFLNNRMEKQANLRQGPEIMSIGDVTVSTKPLVREIQRMSKKTMALLEKIPHQEVNEEEASLFDILWLLLASVIFVPIFQKLPGGSPVLGYLAAGVLIGPYGLSFIRHVHVTKAIAEFGVVFLLFNIGLELSVERLSSMKKYVFGLGSAQVLATALAIGLFAHFVCGVSGPGSLVLGNGLALSSTAVVLQVLQERGESTSRHGRAAFSVLLFQDLAVVVLLILIPLLSSNSSKGGVGFQVILEALGVSAVKAVIAIAGIIAGGRLLLRPIYNRMAENQNAEIFAANTLLVVLGTSVLTARAGLSMALGAFLAGLLLAETEFALQVESDIAPYRGLLLGLFFMTVGMSIDPKLFVARFPTILGTLCLLIAGKTFLVASVGQVFGLSAIAAIRAGLLLAPGGEFAFVAFGEAVNQGIMTPQMCSLLFLVVGLSMALTPWLGAGGQFIAARFEQQDVRSLLPAENETDDLQDHIIICGYGRVGQIIAQLLSERLIPFVALDVRSERVSSGRALDLPVFFGDVGSKEVLHKVGAERASCAVIALDTPGANYRAVWTLSKYFPNVKTFVRAHDVDHGINLEKAGATAVVPETLEPSLQLAAAVLAQAKLPASEIASSIEDFRSRHLSELTELCEASGSCLGYGFSGKSKQLSSDMVSKGKANEDSEWRQEEALATP